MKDQGNVSAAVWVVFGMSLIALSDNFIPFAAERMGLWQLQALRAAMVLPVLLAGVLLAGRRHLLVPVSGWRIAVRSAFALVGLLMYFSALPAVSIAVAAAGLFTSPIWVALFSALFYGERVGPRRILAVAIGFVGVCVTLGVGSIPVAPMALVMWS